MSYVKVLRKLDQEKTIDNTVSAHCLGVVHAGGVQVRLMAPALVTPVAFTWASALGKREQHARVELFDSLVCLCNAAVPQGPSKNPHITQPRLMQLFSLACTTR